MKYTDEEIIDCLKKTVEQYKTTNDFRVTVYEEILDLIKRKDAEIERLMKRDKAKCGTCAYAKPTTFGKSKCYVECTNQEHIEKFCRYRKISLKRQKTTPACKKYKEMVGDEK